MEKKSFPQLRRVGDLTQLWVNDKPFLVLGGELGNSTASDLTVLHGALAKCQSMNLNTIMLPVYWDLIEPVEGQFDFSLVKGAIDLARTMNLWLIPLWFGTWKNSMSCYAPAWMKTDTTRFDRVVRSSGELEEIISPYCKAACDCDTRAFAQLIRFIREYDAGIYTVIMVQVENEIGMIPEARDHSGLADRAYLGEVPTRLLGLLIAGELGPEIGMCWENAGRRSAGTWREVFGSSPLADEIFSAWAFSTFVENVALAGKREYSLPMFTNAALIRPGYQPGQYPSAGPLPHLLEIWRAGAPSLDMLCPDIYFPNFMEWAGRYRRAGNPLFIPEMAASMRASGNAVYALAHCKAMGVGPFAIEDLAEDSERLIKDCYGMLSEMSELILSAQRDNAIIGLSPQINFDWKVDEQPQRGELGGIRFDACFDMTNPAGDTGTTVLPTLGSGRWQAPPGTPLGAAMIIQLPVDEFVVLGMGVTITFMPVDGEGRAGILRMQEGQFKNEQWVGIRWLNGDQTHQGRHLHLPDGSWSVQRFTLYRY